MNVGGQFLLLLWLNPCLLDRSAQICWLRLCCFVCFRGISIGAALRAASHAGTVEAVSSMKYEPSSVWGYVEVSFGLSDPVSFLDLHVLDSIYHSQLCEY